MSDKGFLVDGLLAFSSIEIDSVLQFILSKGLLHCNKFTQVASVDVQYVEGVRDIVLVN